MQTESTAFETLCKTTEVMGSRLVAVELVLRALWVTHQNPQSALTYLERYLGQTLAQPQLLDNPKISTAVREYVENLTRPAPTNLPK